MVRALKSQRPLYVWNRRTPFFSVHSLRLGMKNLGFIESEPWVWKPPTRWRHFFKQNEQSLGLSESSNQQLGWQLGRAQTSSLLKIFKNENAKMPGQWQIWATLGLNDHSVQNDLKSSRKELEPNGALMCFVSTAALYSACQKADFQIRIAPSVTVK